MFQHYHLPSRRPQPMVGIIVMLQVVLVPQVHAKGFVTNNAGDARKSTNEVLDKVVDRFFDHAVWAWPLRRTDLKHTILQATQATPKKKGSFRRPPSKAPLNRSTSVQSSLAPISVRRKVDFKGARRELDASLATLFGVEQVKKKVHELIKHAMLEKFSASFLKGKEISKSQQNMAFLGPPGTGKTTVARMMAQAFVKLGLVRHSGFLEMRPDKLMADKSADTETVLAETLRPGLGGVVFIDEAYLLSSTTFFSTEEQEIRISALMKIMDEHQEDTVFIFAGYEFEMDCFLNSNDGLRRRIPQIFKFSGFSANAFLNILKIKAKKQHVGLLRDVSTKELEEKMSEYSMNISQPSNTKDRFISFLEKDFAVKPNQVKGLFNSIPVEVRDKMGGHLVDVILAEAYATRGIRVLDEQLIDLDDGTCLPKSQVIQEAPHIRKVFGSACPVLWFYTLKDLTAAKNKLLSAWGLDNKTWIGRVKDALGVFKRIDEVKKHWMIWTDRYAFVRGLIRLVTSFFKAEDEPQPTGWMGKSRLRQAR
eukprot:gnl/MRDRNA2_/MRDRNA2_200241_c0_seq1.p1 gnl/MRDRNA2_/MRDRNA2_200241_c0~~gnl/MRDRNA2_/MRDRNA2_200241_c0_seq1.p1  ORF type:complete len:536 (+),score=103.22 gnl/MRDRNA2_/MRDRNA2_200241_c0_seq1:61-1668(+)